MLQKVGCDYDKNELLEKLNNLTYDSFKKWKKNWLKRMRFEWFIMGNFTKTKAIEIIKESEKEMEKMSNSKNILKKEEINQIRSVKLTTDKYHIFEYISPNENEKNSAIDLYFQYKKNEKREAVQVSNKNFLNIFK